METRRDHTAEPWGSPQQVALLALAAFGVLVVLALWVGGQAASIVTGHGAASGNVLAAAAALLHPGSPGRAWASAMPPAVPYWLIASPVAAGLLIAVLVGAHRIRRRMRHPRQTRPTRLADRPGMATPDHVRRNMGAAAIAARARSLRPALAEALVTPEGPQPTGRRAAAALVRPPQAPPTELGWCWGTSGGQKVRTSVRDAVVILGPSGAGKTAYIAVPRILDAPGAVIVTSTRADILTRRSALATGSVRLRCWPRTAPSPACRR